MRLTIVGAGRAAWTFASIAFAAGHDVTIISRREPADAFKVDLRADCRSFDPRSVRDADLLLFALSDDAIEPIYRSFESAIPRSALVFHASGALSSDLFTHPNRFSLHPLCSLPAVGEPVSLHRSLMTWEGATTTRTAAETLTRAGGGEFRAIETHQKPLYHAAAVFGSNYVAASLAAASRLFAHAGIAGPDEAVRTLALSAVRNWSEQDGDERFTGPISRGDAAVVRAHLEALEPHPVYEAAYRALAGLLLEELIGSADPDLQSIAALIGRNRQS